MDTRELLVHIRVSSSNRQIAQDMRLDRQTVDRYRAWFKVQGLLEQTMPEHQPSQNVSSVEPYRELVT